MLTTNRGQLPYPAGGESNDIPRDFNVLAGRLSAIMGIEGQGALSARPAASATRWGEYFTVVGDNDPANDGRRYRCNGSAWVELPRLARWRSYTPSLFALDGDANPVLVNDSNNHFRYRVDGDTCRVTMGAQIRTQSAGNPGHGYCVSLPPSAPPLYAETTGTCVLQAQSGAVAVTRVVAGNWCVALQRTYAGAPLMNPNVHYYDCFDIEYEVQAQ